jgi:DNA-binding transcriptional regulator YhcF (GntR family)
LWFNYKTHKVNSKERGKSLIVTIDIDSKVALYEQLKEQIIYGILTGDLERDEQLPSVRQLSSDLGINMHTVSKVYTILDNEGFVTINKKRGVFVALDQNKIRVTYSKEELLRDIAFKVLLLKQVGGNREELLESVKSIEVNDND